ncbi:MAG: Ig-like domain-containing protein [Bacilli bacterium]|nr:Ig-like domain-containing protein [Bacilli bacterium]
MKRNSKLFGILLFSSLAITSLSFALNKPNVEANAYYSPSTTYTTGDAATYYSSIDSSSSGDTLLTALRNLNLSRRKSTVGYSAMGTSASSSAYIYTDYDPSTVKTDSNGQPYGTSILSFYSGTSTTSWNREHVWPNSRGGGSKGSTGAPYIDADIYMPRPTIAAENSNRGNSEYIEGMSHSSNGWDPVTAFGEDGCYQGLNIRGECARIIFYCMTVNANLTLDEGAGSNGTNMGKLSDMLKWNLLYPVNERERNRQEGGQYLQGNRNAFVDHPEYACKIWGNTNSTTKSICSSYSLSTLEKITLNTTNESLVYGQTLQLSVTPTPSDASALVTWKSSNPSVASVDSKGLVTAGTTAGYASITATSANDASITATCNIYVTEPTKVDMTSVNPTSLEVSVGTSGTISPTVNPSNVYPAPTFSYKSNNTSIATVTSSGVVTGVSAGTTTITITATQGSIVKTANCTVTVNTSIRAGEWEVATSISDGDYVVIGCASKNVTAGAQNDDYLAKVATTIASDKITSLPDATTIFKVGKSGTYYTFTDTTSNKLLGTNAAKSVNLTGAGTTNWSVTFNESTKVATITSENSSCGSIQYNSGSPRFTTYTSSQSAVQLYKKVASSTASPTVTLEPNSLTLTTGDKYTLTATVGGPTNTLSFTSSNDAVATVSATGVVTAIKEGSAVITATYGTASATCTVTVKNSVSLSSLSVSGTLSKTTYYAGQSFDPSGLTITATYSDSSTANVTNQVTFSPDPLTVGTSSVTASYKYNGTTKTATITGFTTVNPSLSEIKLTGQTTSYNLNATFSFDGTCQAYYTDGTNKSVTPTAVSSPDMTTTGTKEVTVTYTENGVSKTATYSITVTNQSAVTYIASANHKNQEVVSTWTGSPITLTFNKNEGSNDPKYYDNGTSTRLYAKGTLTVSGETNINITQINITFGNNNANAFTADVGALTCNTSSAKWTGNNNSVTFTVGGSKDSRYIKSVEVIYTVSIDIGGGGNVPEPDSVTLDLTSHTMNVGESITLTATANGTVTWSSSDPTVASVDNGTVTGVKAGTATITATVGTASATCEITVNNVPSSSVSGDITFGTIASEDGKTLTSTDIIDFMTAGSSLVTGVTNITRMYKGTNGIRFGSSKGTGSMTLNMSSTFTSQIVKSIKFTTAAYGSDTGTLNVTLSSGESTSITPSDGETIYELVTPSSISTIKFETSTKRAVLSAISFTYQETGSYSASDFANDLLALTNDICLDSKNNNWKDVSSSLTSAWTTLQDSDHYQKLSVDEKAILINTTANEAGTTIEQAMNRYDHIVARYDLTNFISGRTISTRINNFMVMDSHTFMPIVVIISLASISLIGFFYLKKRND